MKIASHEGSNYVVSSILYLLLHCRYKSHHQLSVSAELRSLLFFHNMNNFHKQNNTGVLIIP